MNRQMSNFSASLIPTHGIGFRLSRRHRTNTLIEEAIRLKEQDKYPPALKRQTALVIGGSLFIDDEQVQSYISSGKVAATTFSEVWIVFDDRAVLLKQRRP